MLLRKTSILFGRIRVSATIGVPLLCSELFVNGCADRPKNRQKTKTGDTFLVSRCGPLVFGCAPLAFRGFHRRLRSRWRIGNQVQSPTDAVCEGSVQGLQLLVCLFEFGVQPLRPAGPFAELALQLLRPAGPFAELTSRRFRSPSSCSSLFVVSMNLASSSPSIRFLSSSSACNNSACCWSNSISDCRSSGEPPSAVGLMYQARSIALPNLHIGTA